MNQDDFSTSQQRAKRAQTWTRQSGNTTRDFKWVTGFWHWWPLTVEVPCHFWNEAGGPALQGIQRRTYWLCLGWSRIEVLPEDNPIDTIQNGRGRDGRR